tara:strand:- start:1086 stop:1280 length:195 start_codon:yes stop_codon:yes gene_type:complete
MEDREKEYAKQMKVVRLFDKDDESFNKTDSNRAINYSYRLLKVHNGRANATLQKYLTLNKLLLS